MCEDSIASQAGHSASQQQAFMRQSLAIYGFRRIALQAAGSVA
jgi:hypothetical protein